MKKFALGEVEGIENPSPHGLHEADILRDIGLSKQLSQCPQRTSKTARPGPNQAKLTAKMDELIGEINTQSYALPMDFRYFFDLRSPIRAAFFFTASVSLASWAAIWAVGVFGKSFLSRFVSLFAQRPFTTFFFFAGFFFFAAFFRFTILCFLSQKTVRRKLPLCVDLATGRIIIYE